MVVVAWASLLLLSEKVLLTSEDPSGPLVVSDALPSDDELPPELEDNWVVTSSDVK
jgi:hypothetical protein